LINECENGFNFANRLAQRREEKKTSRLIIIIYNALFGQVMQLKRRQEKSVIQKNEIFAIKGRINESMTPTPIN
jgi:hypothetical protein